MPSLGAERRPSRPPFCEWRTVVTAWTAGQIPEMMRHQAEYYEEEASRWLVLLTRAAGFGIWFVVACLIVWVIFRMFLFYLGMLDPDRYR